jgi:5-methylthioribose kinase
MYVTMKLSTLSIILGPRISKIHTVKDRVDGPLGLIFSNTGSSHGRSTVVIHGKKNKRFARKKSGAKKKRDEVNIPIAESASF